MKQREINIRTESEGEIKRDRKKKERKTKWGEKKRRRERKRKIKRKRKEGVEKRELVREGNRNGQTEKYREIEREEGIRFYKTRREKEIGILNTFQVVEKKEKRLLNTICNRGKKTSK